MLAQSYVSTIIISDVDGPGSAGARMADSAC